MLKVSVLITTYNHERFIAQAIESVLMQETDFPYEILIGEDCSTDSTREIILTYQARYPDNIKAVLFETNGGGHANFSRLLNTSKGDYIAWLEGDDYWTHPQKLQKQADFLDLNPDFSICLHNMLRVFEDSPQAPQPTNTNQAWLTTMADLARGSYIFTASVMYRKHFNALPEWVYHLPFGDWPTHLLHAQYGNIGYLDEMMAVYRIHPQGTWTQKSALNQLQERIYVAEVCKQMFPQQYEWYFNFAIVRWRFDSIKLMHRASKQIAWAHCWKIIAISLKHPTVFPSFLRRKHYYQKLKQNCANLYPNVKR